MVRRNEAIARTGRDESVTRGNKAVTRRDEAVGLTGRSETVIARAGRDEAFARGDELTGPGGCVAVVVIWAGNRQAATRAAGGLRDRQHCQTAK